MSLSPVTRCGFFLLHLQSVVNQGNYIMPSEKVTRILKAKSDFTNQQIFGMSEKDA